MGEVRGRHWPSASSSPACDMGHILRTSRVEEECTPRTTVWRVNKGKSGSRAAFRLAVPTHVAHELNYEEVIDEKTKGTAAHRLLLPDLVVGARGLQGKCTVTDRTMGRSKFLGLAASFVQRAHGQKVTGYTLRRWLSSVAQGVKLPLERRGDLGNWGDCVGEKGTNMVSEPMAVLYSSTRLEANAQVKRVCCAAVNHLLKWEADGIKHRPPPNGGSLWEHLGGCAGPASMTHFWVSDNRAHMGQAL